MAKRWTKRRFFKFTWTPPEEKPVVAFGQFKLETIPIVRTPLPIYGYEEDSEHEEDHRYIDECLARDRVFGCWFSTKCQDGEWGTNPIARMVQITEEEFETARAVGFNVFRMRAPRKEGL